MLVDFNVRGQKGMDYLGIIIIMVYVIQKWWFKEKKFESFVS